MDLMPRKSFLDDLFTDMFPVRDNMKCDIYEKDDKYFIDLDLPGFNKEDIKIDVENGYLNISADKDLEREEKDEDKKYIRRERFSGSFNRSFYLGDIDEDNINASFENGILTIEAPKEQVESKKYIEIK